MIENKIMILRKRNKKILQNDDTSLDLENYTFIAEL